MRMRFYKFFVFYYVFVFCKYISYFFEYIFLTDLHIQSILIWFHRILDHKS